MKNIIMIIILNLILVFNTYGKDPHQINIGVLYHGEKQNVFKNWKNIEDYLNKNFDEYLVQIIPLTHEEIEENIHNRMVDFVAINPSYFVVLKYETNLLEKIATIIDKHKNKPLYGIGGVIIAKSDRVDINTLEDLVGKTVGIPNKTAGLYAYHAQLYELYKKDINAKKINFKIISSDQSKIVEAVLKGEVDVGFIRAGLIEQLAENKKIDLSKLKFINKKELKSYPFSISTDLYPGWAFCALTFTDYKIKNKMMTLLLNIDPNSDILKNTNIYGFKTPDDYLIIENILRKLRVRPFDTPLEVTLKDIYSTYKIFIQLIAVLLLIVFLLLVGLIVYNRKIKELHKKVEQDKEILDAVIEGTRAGYWVWDLPTNKVKINEQWANLLGYKLEELEPVSLQTWENLTHPEDLQKAYTVIKKHLDGEVDYYQCDIRMKHKDGHWVWVIDRGKISKRDQDGKPIEMAGTHIDITEKKLTELALMEEKEKLFIILRSIGDGVIATDSNGNIFIMNSVAEKLTGWSLEEAKGRFISDVFNIYEETTSKKMINPVEKVLETGEIHNLENSTILVSKNGEKHLIADSAAPIKGNDGEILGVVLVFRDVTEKQKLMETLTKAQKLESLGILAGGIAHDFNNILQGIFGYIEIAMNETKEEKTMKLLEKSRSAIERAKGLSNHLLTFAKGGAPIKKVQPLVPWLTDTVKFYLSGSNVAYNFKIAESLHHVSYDPNQLGRVIDNLVMNAKQAMPNGGNLEVIAENVKLDEQNVYKLKPGDYVRIIFKDTGCGIPKDIIGKIFDPFFSTKQMGSGLGLSICYSIIQRHDGAIDVESEVGKGTTFYIFLPSAKPTTYQEVQNEKDTKKTFKGKVIVMDDEEFIRDYYKNAFKMLGIETLQTKDGHEAIELYKKMKENGEKIDAIFCDLTIPGGLGGIEVVQEIRKFDSSVKIFVCSGYSDDPVMQEPLDYGFNGSIEKPFTFEKLKSVVEQYFE